GGTPTPPPAPAPDPLTAGITATTAISGAAPLDVTLKATVTGGTSPYSYKWDFDGDGVIDFTTATASATYPEAGSFDVSLTVTDKTGKKVTVSRPGYVSVSAPAANAPTISAIADKTVTAGSAKLSIPFTIADTDTPVNS